MTETHTERPTDTPEVVSFDHRNRIMTMAVNLRLTHAIKDRVVQSFQLNASELLINFVDGSMMNVKIVDPIAYRSAMVPAFARSPKMTQSFCSSVKTTVRSTSR